MRAQLRLMVCALVVIAAAWAVPPTALGETPGGSPLTEASFTVPGALTEAEQAAAEKQAKSASPEAVAERESSNTKFENLSSEKAATVAQEAFPEAVDTEAGGPPALAPGQTITGYPTNHTAQLNLGNGKRGLFESTVPLALETSPGQWSPVSLALGEVNGAFEPKRPVVGVRIPQKLSEGVQLAPGGVSLTPVDASGAPLNGAEGVETGRRDIRWSTVTRLLHALDATPSDLAAEVERQAQRGADTPVDDSC